MALAPSEKSTVPDGTTGAVTVAVYVTEPPTDVDTTEAANPVEVIPAATVIDRA